MQSETTEKGRHISEAKAFLKELEQNEIEKAASRLATNFAFSSMRNLPAINKAKYLVQMKAIKHAFPDWSFNATEFHETDDVVRTKLKITGTHKGELETFIPRVGAVKATGKRIEVPPTPMEMRFRDNKIETIYVQSEPGGCVECVLKLLEVSLPAGWQQEAEIPVRR